jgi:hypothetical protein
MHLVSTTCRAATSSKLPWAHPHPSALFFDVTPVAATIWSHLGKHDEQ